MSSLLAAISMFPESRFWRIRKENKVTYACGGIATLILITTVLAILVIELKLVFDKTQITVNQRKKIILTNKQQILRNANAQENLKPFMVAIQGRGDIPSVTTRVNGIQRTMDMQPCTSSHLDILWQKAYQQYNCLPLNITLYSFTITNKCAHGYMCDYPFPILIQQSIPNPQNSSNSWLTTFESYTVKAPTTSNIVKVQQFKLKKSIINKDNSIFPFQSQKQTTQGFEFDGLYNQFTLPNPFITNQDRTAVFCQFTFTLEEKQDVYDISFYTVLDALSYVGGLFNSLLALFFIVSWYGESLLSFLLAHDYFGSEVAGSYHFFSYIVQSVYRKLALINKKPNWKDAEQREKLSRTVNNLMDVGYLQRRIEFLEKAITVILDRHHLKGLHLLDRITREEADDHYQQHKFRDRVVNYFRQRQSGKVKQSQGQEKRKKAVLETEDPSKKSGRSTSKRPNPIQLQMMEYNDPKVEISPTIQHQVEDSMIREMFIDPLLKKDEDKDQVSLQNKMFDLEPYSESSEDEYDLQGLVNEEFKDDISRLMAEAQGNVDSKSKFIFERIDQQIVRSLKSIVRSRGANPLIPKPE